MDRAEGKAAGGGGERIAYVDAARGLAILCVVLGHLYPGDGIVQYISSFHVPVFFILSGLLMAARDGWKTQRLTEFAAKKAKRLLYPYATISALNLALFRFNAVDLHYSLIGNPALYYANAAAGSYALMKLCKLAFAENRFLRFWGRNSTVVFATHLNFGILEIAKAVTAAALHGRCIPAELAITLVIEAALVFAVNRYAKGLVDCDAARKAFRRDGQR